MTDKFFYVDRATFDLNYRETNIIKLGLICSPENAKELLGIIENSEGKLVISEYKEPENLAEKYRKGTTEVTIKSLYHGIETAVADMNYKYTTYLKDMSSSTLEEIVSEFKSKGFEVYFDETRSYIKISWK